MKRVILIFLIHWLILIYTDIIFSQTAEFQLIVPAPDPVQAGDKINFQIIVVNSGSEEWAEYDYDLEVEIYDSQKKYLAKTGRVKGTEKVESGQTTLVLVSFNVANFYEGIYYFKVGLTWKNQKIAYSDYLSFNVTPLPVIPRPPTQIGGNSIVSYRNDSKQKWENYVGNISLNLLGNIGKNSFVGNLYTYHTPQKQLDIYNIVFNYYTDFLEFSFGDIMPNFSLLALSRTGVRGIQPIIKTGDVNTTILGARSVDPKEGTSTTNGTYARYAYGISEKIDLPLGLSPMLSFVTNIDDENSIKAPGPTLKAKKNDVIGLGLKSNIAEGKVVLLVDYAKSNYLDDIKQTQKKEEDTAYKTGIETKFGTFSTRLNYQMVGTNFYSLASPTIVKDRITNELYSSIGIQRIGNFSGSFTQYVDNLKNDPSKVTTTQKIYSLSSIIPVSKGISLSGSYSVNEITGKPITAVNNKTNLVSLTTLFSLGNLNFTLGIQNSNFRNAASSVTNSDTVSGNFGMTLSISKFLSFSLGVNQTQLKNVGDLSLNLLNTYSLTANMNVIPQKIVVTTNGNYNKRKDNSPKNPQETLTTVANLELTYYFNPKFSVTVGAGVNNLEDKIKSSNSYSDVRANSRISLGF